VAADNQGNARNTKARRYTRGFEELVALSGYRNVVTTNFPPRIFLHDGPVDAVRIVSGVSEFLVSSVGLAEEEGERSRQVLRRLHALGDWAAGEIVERHLRDVERERSGYHLMKPRLTVLQMLLLRFVRRNPGSKRGAVSAALQISADDADQLIDGLIARGILECSASNDELSLSAAEIKRYEAAISELSGHRNGF